MLPRRIPTLLELRVLRWGSSTSQRACSASLLCSLGQPPASSKQLHIAVEPYAKPHQSSLCHGGVSYGFAASYSKKVNKAGGKRRGTKVAEEEEEEEDKEFSLEPYKELMDAAVQYFKKEVGHIHLGTADPALLEPLMVLAHDERVPLRTYGTVTARNPQLLVVTCYNESDLEAVAEAVASSPLKYQARVEKNEVLVPIPKPTQELVERMTKLVNREANEAKTQIQLARRRALKRAKECFASTDELHRAEKQVKDLNDKYTAEVERIFHLKEADLKINH